MSELEKGGSDCLENAITMNDAITKSLNLVLELHLTVCRASSSTAAKTKANELYYAKCQSDLTPLAEQKTMAQESWKAYKEQWDVTKRRMSKRRRTSHQGKPPYRAITIMLTCKVGNSLYKSLLVA